MKRLYTASDVRRYARCPRQWWYEARADELAALDPDEVRQRLDALRRRHGDAAGDLAAYQLLADLAARHERLAHGRDVHRAHAARALGGGRGCLFPITVFLAVVLLLLPGLKRSR